MRVCTHLKGCAGCLVVFFVFFSFPKWNLVVVEKASRFLLCAHFLHSFVFAATHIVDQAFI